MQSTPSKQESDYDIFRYLNFNPDAPEEDFIHSILPDSDPDSLIHSTELNSITHEAIFNLLENEDFMSTQQQHTAIEDYTSYQATSGLRNFAEAFGRPAFGNRCDAVKEAYTNWNINDNFYGAPKTGFKIPNYSSSPLYTWCESDYQTNPWNSKYQQTSNDNPWNSKYQQTSNDNPYLQFPITNNTLNTQQPSFINPNTDYSNYTPNNPFCSSWYPPETPQTPSILSSLLTSTPSSSYSELVTPSPFFQPPIVEPPESTRVTHTPPAAPKDAPKDAPVSKYPAPSREVPNFKPLELCCYDIEPLKFAKCISCTHYINPEDASTAASVPTAPSLIPFQVLPVRSDNAASLYFIAMNKNLPFTAVHTYYPTAPRTPKRYVTVREMIEERNKQRLAHRNAACGNKSGKSKKRSHEKAIEERKTDSGKELEVSTDSQTHSNVEKQKAVKSDDENATTLLCLLPMSEKDRSNSKVCSVIPPIVITDFQMGKVNAKEYKPKHFEMKTLTIGSFQVEAHYHTNGRTRNKLKVVFSKRNFIYEFEYFSDNSPSKMISVEVSFQSLVAIRCFGRFLQIRVKKQPIMYEGAIKPRHGIVCKTPVYDKKQPVDLTDGQITDHPVHRIVLKRSQSNWLRDNLVRFDPWFHALFATPIGDEKVPQKLLPSNYHDWENTCKALKTRKSEAGQRVEEPEAKQRKVDNSQESADEITN